MQRQKGQVRIERELIAVTDRLMNMKVDGIEREIEHHRRTVVGVNTVTEEDDLGKFIIT